MTDVFDLYEFPAGHTGRKTYVSVRGHSRSIPVCYTYRGADGRNYVHPDFGGSWGGIAVGGAAPGIMKDIGEYVSPLDGSSITSRSQHREHLARHDVIEVGNERVGRRDDSRSAFDGRAIKRHLDEVRSMPQREYNERVQRTAREY